MAVWFKRVLIGLVAFAIFALVGIAIFLLTFDPNVYKDKVRDVVFERYQRTLTINGDIELSLFPRIGLALHDVSLSQRNSDVVFASFDTARVAVAIWPLLSNHLVVDHVSVAGFKAWVEREDDGTLNFQDLLTGGATDSLAVAAAGVSQAIAPDKTEASDDDKRPLIPGLQAGISEMHVDIAGLDLRGGAIHVQDVQSGLALDLQNLDIKTGRITSDQAFDVVVKGRLTGDDPRADASVDAQAMLQFSPERRTVSAQQLSVSLAGRLPGFDAKQVSLRGNLGYSAFAQNLEVSNLELLMAGDTDGDTPIQGLDASLIVPRLNFNRSQMDLQLEKLALRARGALSEGKFELAADAPLLTMGPQSASGDAVTGMFRLTGEQTLGLNVSFDGIGGSAVQPTAKEFRLTGQWQTGGRMTQLDLSSPLQWNVMRRNGTLSAIKGDLRIEDKALPDGSFEFPMIGSAALDLVEDQGRADINAVLEGSKLDLQIRAAELLNPRISFSMAAEKLNLDPFLASDTQVVSPEDVTSNDVQQEPAAQATDAETDSATTSQAAVATPLQFDFLNDIDVRGDVNIGELQWKTLRLASIKAQVQAAQGRLSISDVSANLYGGSLRGEASLTSDAVVHLKGSLSKVNIEALSQSLLDAAPFAGVGSVTLDLTSAFADPDQWLRTLNGKAQIQLLEGAFKGIDAVEVLQGLNEAIRSAFKVPVTLPAGSVRSGSRTEFAKLDAALSVENGTATITTLNASAPYLRIRQGKPAQFSLPDQSLNVMLNVSVINTGRGDVGRSLRALQGVSIPVRIIGTFAQPDYEIQWKQVGSSVVQRAVKGGLLNVVREALPEAVQQQDSATSVAPAPQDKAGKGAEAARAIEQAIKGLLK